MPTTSLPSRSITILSRGLLAGVVFACATSPLSAQVAGSIEVYPQTSSLEIASTRRFSSYVPISPNTIVWLVNGVQGGSASTGTISATGLYTPPATIPVQNVLTVTAQSTAYPTSRGNATLTLTRPSPSLWSVSPSSLGTGQYTVSFNGSNFAPDSQALANGVPIQTTYVSPTKIVAGGTAASPGDILFAVQQPGPGAVTGNTVKVKVTTVTVSVTVSPASANVPVGGTRAFAANVTGSTNTSVTWLVNGVGGGSSGTGTITSAGLYTAPAVMPSASTVVVRAVSNASPSAAADAQVALVAPVVVSVSPSSATVTVAKQQVFSASVSGTTNSLVTWSVNGIAGGSATVGTITASGLYTAPTILPSSTAVTIRATSAASNSSFAQAAVTLTGVPPPSTSLGAARLLEQSSFGPTPATLAHVQDVGVDAYLDEQFAMTETQIPSPTNNGMGELRQWMLYNYTTAPDQLRQRVAYALSQIVVTSGNKLVYANEMLPWLRLLSQHAFGNYRDLLRDISRSPSMGKYLDLANSVKPSAAGGANENYPRELMQLFSIGLWELNQDGSQAVGPDGSPIPTYDQATVRQVALALTGWTYATAPGAQPRTLNWEYFGAPMETRPASHDMSAKTFLGCSLPSGQPVQQDLDDVIDCLMRHKNIAPFVATRLIRSLVESNPSPAYVQRIADVFAGRKGNTVGDLKATVRAILTDPEARMDVPTAKQGRLKEPILQVSGLLRALNGRFSPTNGLSYLFDYMGQSILTPPSVFSWFSPLYRIPGTTTFGPEFQIYSPPEAILRGNFVYMLLTNPGGDATIDLSPFQPYGNDLPNLVEAANQTLLYGRMPPEMKEALVAAANPGYDANTRIATVIYLTALSGQYAVQY